MNRIDRLSALLIHLQTKSRVRMEELEDRFEVSRRTLFRDIRSLMESGVPIGGDATEGYFIVEGYHLPPVAFNKEEAAALLLASKLMHDQTDANTRDKIADAMHKVRAALRYADRDFLETLEKKIEILPPLRNREKQENELYLADIQQALVTNQVLEIHYHSNYNDESSRREVEPLTLVHYSNHWHLIGYCRLRQDMRDFRTDRIRQLKLTGTAFDAAAHADFPGFTERMIGGTDAKKATIYFSDKVARFIQDQKHFNGFIEEKKVTGGVEMKFVTHNYNFLAYWLLSFADLATALTPPEFVELVGQLSERAYLHHKKFIPENSVT